MGREGERDGRTDGRTEGGRKEGGREGGRESTQRIPRSGDPIASTQRIGAGDLEENGDFQKGNALRPVETHDIVFNEK